MKQIKKKKILIKIKRQGWAGGRGKYLPVEPLKNFHPQGFTGRTRVKEI
jgi:hypothetical protein